MEKLLFFTAPPISIDKPSPICSDKVSAGFPSPAENYIEGELNLNTLLVKNPSATFFVKVSGDSMIGSGIHPNDILIVDRSIDVKNNDIIIASVNREFTVKRFRQDNNSIRLEPENPKYKPIIITESMDFEVWGIVTSVIHKVH